MGGNAAPNQIDDVDRQIIRLKLANRNLSLTEIGKLLPKPLSKQAVSKRMKNNKFKIAWDSLEFDIMDKLKALQHDAVKVMAETLKSPDKKLRFHAARELLQRILVDSDGLIPANVEDEILEFTES